jgi:hypothetical protein
MLIWVFPPWTSVILIAGDVVKLVENGTLYFLMPDSEVNLQSVSMIISYASYMMGNSFL